MLPRLLARAVADASGDRNGDRNGTAAALPGGASAAGTVQARHGAVEGAAALTEVMKAPGDDLEVGNGWNLPQCQKHLICRESFFGWAGIGAGVRSTVDFWMVMKLEAVKNNINMGVLLTSSQLQCGTAQFLNLGLTTSYGP